LDESVTRAASYHSVMVLKGVTVVAFLDWCAMLCTPAARAAPKSAKLTALLPVPKASETIVSGRDCEKRFENDAKRDWTKLG